MHMYETPHINSSFEGVPFTYWPEAAIADTYDGPNGTVQSRNLRTGEGPLRDYLLDNGIEIPKGYPEVDVIIDAIHAGETTSVPHEALVEKQYAGTWFVVQAEYQQDQLKHRYELMRLASAELVPDEAGITHLTVKRHPIGPEDDDGDPMITLHLGHEQASVNTPGGPTPHERSYAIGRTTWHKNDGRQAFPSGPVVKLQPNGGKYGMDPANVRFYPVADEAAQTLLRLQKQPALWNDQLPWERSRGTPLANFVVADPRISQETWADRETSQGAKALLDELISQLPDTVPSYPADQKDQIPRLAPSQLERYMRSKLAVRTGEQNYRQDGTLSPEKSIGCLADQVRTKQFLRAVSETIANFEASGAQRIEVCDAGTGAIPIMAIYAALCSDKVRCTALELNEQSARMARDVVRAFGLEGRITIIETDAITYQPERPVDLLISETMNTGLTNEPMVDILSNLHPYVRPGGVTLPSAVAVKAALVPLDEFTAPSAWVRPGRYVHPNVKAVWHPAADYEPGQQLETISVSLPTAGLKAGKYLVALASKVTVGSRILEGYQSLLSQPYYLRAEDDTYKEYAVPLASGSEAVELRYAPGSAAHEVQVRS